MARGELFIDGVEGTLFLWVRDILKSRKAGAKNDIVDENPDTLTLICNQNSLLKIPRSDEQYKHPSPSEIIENIHPQGTSVNIEKRNPVSKRIVLPSSILHRTSD